MDASWGSYRDTLNSELGVETAGEFVSSLFTAVEGSTDKAAQLFYELGKTWAPMLRFWAEWVRERRDPNFPVAIILRDAKPLAVLPQTRGWAKLYINRQTCGVPDELAGYEGNGPHPLLRDYLCDAGCLEGFTFVDSGCYGTVVLRLYNMGLLLHPLFFFSKNPFIPGFVNRLVGEKDGEILNDSLECAFPHLYQRPGSFLGRDGRSKIVLKKADLLSVRFGRAALQGVKDGGNGSLNPEQAVRHLISLSERAREGYFTGVLPHSSPEWSGKRDFLNSWPSDLCWR